MDTANTSNADGKDGEDNPMAKSSCCIIKRGLILCLMMICLSLLILEDAFRSIAMCLTLFYNNKLECNWLGHIGSFILS